MPLHTSAQPSTRTNSSSLQGNEMTGGESMNIPRPNGCVCSYRPTLTDAPPAGTEALPRIIRESASSTEPSRRLSDAEGVPAPGSWSIENIQHLWRHIVLR